MMTFPRSFASPSSATPGRPPSTAATAPAGLAVQGRDGRLVLANPALCRLLGRDAATLQGRTLREFTHPDDLHVGQVELADLIAGRVATCKVRKRLLPRDGSAFWVELSASCIRGDDGLMRYVIWQVVELGTGQSRPAPEPFFGRAGRSARPTGSDPLTGLPDRTWILDRLGVELRSASQAGTRVAVLFLDMDDFRVINDALGHAAGDEVLVAVADRISGELGARDHAGRFGEDEFLVLLPEVGDAAAAERFAERVSTAIAAELRVQGHRIVPTASIGIALSTSTSTTQSLLRDTDSAMFRAKAAGRARWHFLDEETHHLAVARMLVEEQLREAISAGQLVVKYQPIAELATGTVLGHEALVRWLHPNRGLVGPDQFLDVAEASRLINPIGARVLDEACAMLARRPDLPGTISVNVSPVQLATPGWLDGVTETLARHRVDPRRLVIELTETVAMGMTPDAGNALETLSEQGVGIHLDDFGTGYSSISLLRDLPVSAVKLDIRFVHDLTPGPSRGNALVHGLGGLVADLGLIGIAEGVETQAQIEMLRAQGWHYGQGYHLARPAEAPVTQLPGYASRG